MTRFMSKEMLLSKCSAQKKWLNSVTTEYTINKSRGIKHPVLDFLFKYYSFRLTELSNWLPGYGTVITGLESPPHTIYKKTNAGYMTDLDKFHFDRLSGLDWVIALNESMINKQPSMGCNGLHEWAMVYRTTDIRHKQIHLRLKKDDINQLIDSSVIKCSHYDAYRFYTTDALPLNTLSPDKSNRMEMEQPGCIHANMDLYKWAYKYYPWISSDVIFDAFKLAYHAREIDMKASPYDLSSFGYDPIKIETPEGKKHYHSLQHEIYKRSQPIRKALIKALTELRDALHSDTRSTHHDIK